VRNPTIAILAAFALFVTACAPAATSTPTPSPTPANQLTFGADLKSTNEVPPISNDEKSASGAATITFDLTRDATGKITAATAKFDFNVKDLTAGSTVTLAHIHGPAAAGANAGVLVNTGLTAATGLPGAAVTFSSKSAVTVDAALMQQIIDNPGNYYFNVHSALNPGGVVRGQLAKK
jgi:hypothetical protein